MNDQERTLTPLVNEALSDHISGLPVWVRPPRNSVQEFYTGLSKAKLYELASKGRIKSRSLREIGQTKATRVFNLKSILDYIEACSDGHEETIAK
jgi:hypothetical protein